MATPKKRTVVKTATVDGITMGIVSVPNGAGLNIETDKAAGFGDQEYTQIPRVLASPDDLTVEMIDEGVAPNFKVGDVRNVKITLTYWDGTAEVQKTVTEDCSVKAVAYGTATVDGDRKSTVTVTFAPVGGKDIAPAAGTGS